MAEQAIIQTLHDHDTGKAIAPRTVVEAISGKGKKWNYLGFTEDDQVGVIEGTWPCNRNILDNPIFSVNQRGQAEYTTSSSINIYTIDRWVLANSSRTGKLSVGKEYITLSADPANGANYWVMLTQKLDTWAIDAIRGEVVTFSMLYKTDSQTSIATRIFAQALGTSLGEMGPTQLVGTNGEWNVISTTFKVDGSVTDRFQICVHHVGEEQIDIDIKAAKLELGPIQTLAHKEGDTWVLNEIPNYTEELAKCQRYQVALLPSWYGGWGMLGIGVANTATNIEILTSLPVNLRSQGTAIYSGKYVLSPNGAFSEKYPVTNMSISYVTEGMRCIRTTASGGGLSAGTTYVLLVDMMTKPRSFLIDANL